MKTHTKPQTRSNRVRTVGVKPAVEPVKKRRKKQEVYDDD
jgi:hypothetical protein